MNLLGISIVEERDSLDVGCVNNIEEAHKNKPLCIITLSGAYNLSPTIGKPSSDKWIRSWCVLPVFGCSCTKVKFPFCKAGTCWTVLYSVNASWFFIGDSIVPFSGRLPATIAW